jgi:hypothetical protein
MKYLFVIDGSEYKTFNGELTQEQIEKLQEGFVEVYPLSELKETSFDEVRDWINS